MDFFFTNPVRMRSLGYCSTLFTHQHSQAVKQYFAAKEIESGIRATSPRAVLISSNLTSNRRGLMRGAWSQTSVAKGVESRAGLRN